MLTPGTLHFLSDLLDSQAIRVNDPNFATIAAQAATAKAELADALEELERPATFNHLAREITNAVP